MEDEKNRARGGGYQVRPIYGVLMPPAASEAEEEEAEEKETNQADRTRRVRYCGMT